MPAWTSSRGRIFSSQCGIHQLRSPSSCMTAGTSTIRTSVASRKIADVRPMPNSFRETSGAARNARNTTTMIAAAAVITPAVLGEAVGDRAAGVAVLEVLLADARDQRRIERDEQQQRRPT